MFPPEKDDWKKFKKNNLAIALNDLYSKKKKYILLMFQWLITYFLIVIFSMIPITESMALPCNKKVFRIIKRNNV